MLKVVIKKIRVVNVKSFKKSKKNLNILKYTVSNFYFYFSLEKFK